MFTGLIEQVGEVFSHEMIDHENSRLIVRAEFEDIAPGESVAVDGVCLTCLPVSEPRSLVFDLSCETRRLTTLSSLKPGQAVHLEKAMLATTRFGGHYLTGHVDGQLILIRQSWHGASLEQIFSGVDDDAQLYVVPKGSVSLAGVSLTINWVEKNELSVMLVPHTLSMTTLKDRVIGQAINVEYDYFAKIIAYQVKKISQHR